MADDPFDFLEPQAAPASDVAPSTPAPVDPAPAPDTAPAVEGAAPAQAEQESRNIPLPTALEWRDGMKEQRRRADAAEAELQRFRASQQGPSPTVYDDPAAWQAEQDARWEAREAKLRLDMSDRFATQAHGADRVQVARTWGAGQVQQDPTFLDRMLAQPDPVGWMVDQHRQSEQLSALGGKSLEEAVQERIKALGLVAPVVDGVAQPPAAQAVPATVASPAPPPRSLASTPSASAPSGSGKLTDKEMFDSAF